MRSLDAPRLVAGAARAGAQHGDGAQERFAFDRSSGVACCLRVQPELLACCCLPSLPNPFTMLSTPEIKPPRWTRAFVRQASSAQPAAMAGAGFLGVSWRFMREGCAMGPAAWCGDAHNRALHPPAGRMPAGWAKVIQKESAIKASRSSNWCTAALCFARRKKQLLDGCSHPLADIECKLTIGRSSRWSSPSC